MQRSALRVASLILSTAVLVTLTSGSLRSQSASQPTATRARQTFERALQSPFDDAAFREFLAGLPRAGDFYVLEGDLLFTEAEVRRYLIGQTGAETRAGIKPELVVNLQDGRRDFYASLADRTLSYFVDRSGFSEEGRYRTALLAVRSAATAWQDACPQCNVTFRQVERPLSSEEARLGFVVREVNVEGAFIAASFFPSDAPARRTLQLDRSFFVTSFDPIGVIRHELGHVLGYRHEHIRGIAGCAREDQRWLPLTPYDPHSVMHYMCGGAGALSLALTPTDVAGHRALYGPPPSAAFVEPPQTVGLAADARRAFEAARANPFDTEKRSAYFATLPRLGDYYVVEGDLRMTEQEVVGYLLARGDADMPAQRSAELIVNLHAGREDSYPPGSRNLTYFIDRATFRNDSDFQAAAKAVDQATREWEAACATCGIRFTQVSTTTPPPNFIARLFDSNGEFIAAAFFPHDPPARRFVDIDPSFFTTTFDRVGVLRHELGHVLGYRHEHIRDVPGCFHEDNQWKPLTTYDPRSVMHYFCGGAGNLKLELTPLDREGHTKLYATQSQAFAGSSQSPAQTARGRGSVPSSASSSAGASGRFGGPRPAPPPIEQAPPPPPPQPAGVLVVSLEGGEVVDNAASVMRVLNGLKALPTASYTVTRGDAIDSIYRQQLALPWFSAEMTKLASELNSRDYAARPLKVGEQVTYPAVKFAEDTYGVKSDKQQIDQIEQKWGHLIVGGTKAQQDRPSDSTAQTRVRLRRFELRLPFTNEGLMMEAHNRINALKNKNIVVSIDRPPAGSARYFGHGEDPPSSASRTYRRLNEFAEVAERRDLKEGEQGLVLSTLGLGADAIKGKRVCTPAINCPEVILVDKRVLVHPDVRDGVLGEDLDVTDANKVLVARGSQMAEIAQWDEKYHATHLAGIVGARDNGFGIVGVDPEARVISWNWDTLVSQPSRVANDISHRQSDADTTGAFQIYLFATGWAAAANDDPQIRRNKDALARRLDEEKPLVVAAAGQQAAGVPGKPVTAFSTLGPMYLGDQPYVIVVSACDPCQRPNAALFTDANFSRQFVHVAAPGKNMFSTAGKGSYTVASGTSQAAAFVAGLASAMVARYPSQYRSAFQVKVRLEVTSTPLELLGGNSADIATGIVNPTLATMDPSKHWLKRNGTDWEEVFPAGSFAWDATAKSIEFEDLADKKKSITTAEIWRLVKSGDQWMIYTGSRKGPIEKFGPARPTGSEGGRILFRVNGEGLSLSTFEDLVLKAPTSGL